MATLACDRTPVAASHAGCQLPSGGVTGRWLRDCGAGFQGPLLWREQVRGNELAGQPSGGSPSDATMENGDGTRRTI